MKNHHRSKWDNFKMDGRGGTGWFSNLGYFTHVSHIWRPTSFPSSIHFQVVPFRAVMIFLVDDPQQTNLAGLERTRVAGRKGLKVDGPQVDSALNNPNLAGGENLFNGISL